MAFNFRKKQPRPFEQLITAMNKVVEGQYPSIATPHHAPFSDLTHSFNRMLSHVNHKVTALQTLSHLDHQIAAYLDVNKVTELVIERISALMPDTCVVVMQLQEKAADQTSLHSIISSNQSIKLSRMNISKQELNAFKSSPNGLFIDVAEDTLWEFTQIFDCETETPYFWGYPIQFQGEHLALIILKHAQPFQKRTAAWEEVRALSDRIGVAILSQQRKDELLMQSQYDELTGLPNRILLQDRVKLAIEHSDYVDQPFWLLYLDLDRFKFVNDALGHHAGDRILQVAAERLAEELEDTDTLARFVGDEFVILLSAQTHDNQRMRILRQLIEQMQKPYLIDGAEITVTASIGIATYPNDGETAEQLLKNADIAMLRAKEKGKNTFSFFKQSVNKRVIDRLQMEMQLRKAIENNELALQYQPKVSLQTGKIVGMEALVIWHSELFGMVPSQHFIPLAEETGLITSIGEWVLNTACRQASEWKSKGYDDLLVSVNLSAKQFNQKHFPQTVEGILKSVGMPAHCLELELTETVIMNKAQRSIDMLNDIKAIGVSLSIDDFGTGYSSLSYLQSLPIDTLKIDKSFTDAIVDADSEAPIVASMISLAQNLHLKVVTEGVETPEQVAYLKAQGCDEIQGFVFSKAVDKAAFEQLLANGTSLDC